MIDLLHYQFMQTAILASILGGISCSILGVLIVTMEIPFLGVAISHCAFAGALFGILLGINPLLMAFSFSLFSSLLIGPVADRSNFSPDIIIGVLFSFMLGLAFLFLALIPGPKTEALFLIWGSILAVSRADIFIMAAICFILIIVLIVFFKEIQAVLFNREIARSLGIPDRVIFYGILLFAGAIIAVNLNTIGGLLIFSLVINPAAAAYQLTYSLKKMFFISAIFGVFSCFLGLFFSWYLNFPPGAVIIISSSLIFVSCVVFSPKKRLGSVRKTKLLIGGFKT